jgi:hypothetical protein
MASKIYENLIKECPLETRLTVLNQMIFMDLLTEMGYREDVIWTEAEAENLRILCEAAEKATSEQIETFNKWLADGSPV